MTMSQVLDQTAPRSVPCPSSYVAVNGDNVDGNGVTTCPGCSKHVLVEANYVGPDQWVIEPHQSTRAVDRAIHALAVVVRQQTNGRSTSISPEPDVVDLAHAAELLDALTADPDLVMGLATKVRVRGTRHLDRCFDGAKLDCSCGLGNEEPF